MSSIAIYPGTFDPVTNGHLDVISRGLRIFDRLVVAVARSDRKSPLFTVEERMAMVRQSVRGNRRVTVDSFEGLLVDYARSLKARVVIRGLRAVSDFEYEFQMALMNRKLNPLVEALFLMPSEQYTYLNSTLVKEVARNRGDLDGLVPPAVSRRLMEKLDAKADRPGRH